MKIEFVVNGETKSVESPPQRPLLDVLREDLQLTGTKYGCGEAQCGACSVLMDGKRVFSCTTPASAAVGKTIRTIEGLAPNDESLHPVQRAFLEEQGYQCGFCTCGMIMTAVALLEETPEPGEAEIVTTMNGNFCRCCAYPNIIKAVQTAAVYAKEEAS